MSNKVRFLSETGRSPSPRIFGDIGKLQTDASTGKCIFFFDDFVTTTRHASVSASGGYYTYQDTGATIQGKGTVADLTNELGVLQITSDTTDNDEQHIQFGDGLFFRIDNAAGNTGACGFEARVAINTVADTRIAWMVGLGGPIIAADHIVDAGTFLAAGSFVGFQGFEDDGNQMDTIYQAISQTQQSVLANAVTLVADTYVNIGFRYRPGDIAAKKIRFYVNGVESNTYITETNIDAATFPEGEALAPMILTKNAAGTSNVVSIDWVAAYQYGADAQ